MGTSTTVILGTRRFLGAPFEHLVFDPFGLVDGRGTIVKSYLTAEFGSKFQRVRERSEIGLAKLLDKRGEGAAGLIFIDGDHHFEHVITDFMLADLLCCDNGFIIFHDALFPSIKSTINYISSNRTNYAVSQIGPLNMSVLQKRGPDRREWQAFTPFVVPNRHDWSAASSNLSTEVE